MAQRYSKRGISKARVYTVKNAARIVGVSELTLRKWSRDGLKIIRDKRPHLLRGADLIDYLNKRHVANRNPMTETQCYCMRCKAPKNPMGGAFVFQQTSDLTGRLSGLCGDCGGKFGRFCNPSDLEFLSKVIAISHKPRAYGRAVRRGSDGISASP